MDTSELKKKLGENIDAKLNEAIEILDKTQRYFGVVFDPNDDEMMAEMKRQIRIMEYDENGKKRTRQQLRKRIREVQQKLAKDKALAKKRALDSPTNE